MVPQLVVLSARRPGSLDAGLRWARLAAAQCWPWAPPGQEQVGHVLGSYRYHKLVQAVYSTIAVTLACMALLELDVFGTSKLCPVSSGCSAPCWAEAADMGVSSSCMGSPPLAALQQNRFPEKSGHDCSSLNSMLTVCKHPTWSCWHRPAPLLTCLALSARRCRRQHSWLQLRCGKCGRGHGTPPA